MELITNEKPNTEPTIDDIKNHCRVLMFLLLQTKGRLEKIQAILTKQVIIEAGILDVNGLRDSKFEFSESDFEQMRDLVSEGIEDLK